MNRIVSFDFLRFVLAICVVIGHSYLVLCRQSETDLLVLQNLAVDGFFILSGFLLALSYFHTQSAGKPEDLFFDATRKRVKRLYPEYLFAMIITWAISEFFLNQHVPSFVFPLNLMFIAQINGVPGIINGSWYVSVLFWVGSVYSALLYYQNKTAQYVWVPLLVFCSFSYCFAIYTGLSLNSLPLVGGFFSVGFFKGIMAMGCGILLFFVCHFLQEKPLSFKYKNVIFIILEALAVFVLISCFKRTYLSQKEYLVYFAFPVLIGIYYFHKEVLTSFFSLKLWKPLTDLAYTLFLVHVPVLELAKKYVFGNQPGRVDATYIPPFGYYLCRFCVCLFSCAEAVVCEIKKMAGGLRGEA